MTTPELDSGVRAVLEHAQRIGAIGPAPLDEHVAHAAAFVDAIVAVDPTARSRRWRVLDLGSGGGLPGLVVADRVPSWHVTLLDGRTERIRILAEAIAEIGWTDRVDTVAARAEVAARDPQRRGRFDVVVVRSFAAPAVTAECAAGFLRIGGLLVCSEPEGSGSSRWPEAGCGELNLEVIATPTEPRSFVVLRAAALCPPRYPRRVGIPAKRPLFGANLP